MNYNYKIDISGWKKIYKKVIHFKMILFQERIVQDLSKLSKTEKIQVHYYSSIGLLSLR